MEGTQEKPSLNEIDEWQVRLEVGKHSTNIRDAVRVARMARGNGKAVPAIRTDRHYI